MNYEGSCKCKQWRISVSVNTELGAFNPRVCDCDYCKANPWAIISARDMMIDLQGDRCNIREDKNGNQLATFYHCSRCNDLLAVGCAIEGESRGAVNALLLDQRESLGSAVQIQPRLLSAGEKIQRWNELWGVLRFTSPD